MQVLYLLLLSHLTHITCSLLAPQPQSKDENNPPTLGHAEAKQSLGGRADEDGERRPCKGRGEAKEAKQREKQRRGEAKPRQMRDEKRKALILQDAKIASFLMLR
jgi:hypothetical protein